MISLSRSATWAVSAVLVGTLSACAQYPSQPPVYQQPVYQQPVYQQPAYPQTSYPQNSYPGGNYQNPQGTEYGRVSNIEVLHSQNRGQSSGVGAILGAVVGGVLGNQVGGGSGRVAATAAGAVGGALLGNTVEGRNNQYDGQGQGYRITIQLDRGGLSAYDVSSPGDLRVGDRVRTYNGQISRQ